MKLFFWVICLTTMGGVNCQAQIDSIIIGSGGGFSGQVKKYKIIKNKVLKGEGLNFTSYTQDAVLPKKDFRCISKSAEDFLNSEKEINQPYNIYQFLEIYGNGKQLLLKWGDPTYPVPDKIKKFYDDIYQTINTLKF